MQAAVWDRAGSNRGSIGCRCEDRALEQRRQLNLSPDKSIPGKDILWTHMIGVDIQ